MTRDPLSGDATAIAARLRGGSATARAVTDACLARIAARDDSVCAWAHLDPAAARAQAHHLDGAVTRGPLHGVPVGIKDVLLTRDMPTRYNSDLYDDHAPAIDAACVTLLRQAGAVILGKTTTVELASIGRPPPTRNPHAPEHTPGGSSSGSAAAVAGGQVPLAIGTQTGGSIIRPAGFCGAWALKPTWGTVSTEGAKPFAPSLDTIGWFGRSAHDLALLLDIFDPQPPPAVPALADAHIAVWRTAGWDAAETATRDILAATVAQLRAIGTQVTELDPLHAFATLAETHRTIMFAEGRRAFQAECRTDPERLHPRIADMARTGGGYSPDDLRVAYDRAADARLRFDAMAATFDAVLVPSTIGTAPQGLTSTGDLRFNGIFTLLHVPCVHMPLARTTAGLPIGLTLTGARFDDRRIIALAGALATSLDPSAWQQPARDGA